MKIKLALIILLSLSNLSVEAQTAKEYYLDSETAQKNGDYSDAIVYAEKAKELLNKSNPKIESLLMMAYFNNGDMVNAKIAYETLLKVTPYSKKQSDSFQSYVDMGKQIDKALDKEEVKFQNNEANKAQKRIIKANQIEDDYNAVFSAKKKEQRERYPDKRLFKSALVQDKTEAYAKFTNQFDIKLSYKEKEERKQEKVNLLLEGAGKFEEIFFDSQKYYIAKYLGYNRVFSNSGEVLIKKTGRPISYLGDGYFEIFGRSIKTGTNPQRTSMIYDLKKKQLSSLLTLVDYPQYNAVLLYDDKLKKEGFLQGSTLVLPKYDEFLVITKSISGFDLLVKNRNLVGVISSNGDILVPIEYVKIEKNQTDNIREIEYWCRTVEDYKIAHKYNYKGQYLGKYKMHKSGRYIKKL